MGRLFIWNLRSPAGAAPAPPAFAMMVGKKSLGVHCHCRSEKGEVIVRQERERERTTPEMAGKCFPTEWGRLRAGGERGNSAGD